MYLIPDNGSSLLDVEIAHVDPEMVVYARELADRFPYDPDASYGVAKVIRTGSTEFYPDITDDVFAELHLPEELQKVISQLSLGSSIIVSPPSGRGRRRT